MLGLLIGTLCVVRILWVLFVSRGKKNVSEYGYSKCQHILAEYPRRSFLWGLDFALENLRKNQKHEYLEHAQKTFQTLGSTWRVDSLGTPMIESIEPENLKSVFLSEFSAWQQGNFRIDTFRPLLGNGILSANGKAWEKSRRLIKSGFKSYTADTAIYEKHIQNLVAALPTNSTQIVDLQGYFLKLTMDISTDVLFGTSVLSLLSNSEDFSEAYEKVKDNIFQDMQVYPLGWLRDRREAKAVISKVHDFVDGFIDIALASANFEKADEIQDRRYRFLRQMASELHDKASLRMELLSLLLAGRDTTAGLVSNMFYILSQRGDIRKKIQVEVDRLGGKIPTADELKRLLYLNATIKESLRLHPVTPINSRTAARDTILPVGGGPSGQFPVFVPAGTQFVTSVHALHRRPDIWGADAEEFRPERWQDNSPSPSPSPWHYMPFLGGPRQCPGQNLALNITLYTVVRLLQIYDDILPACAYPWQGAIAVTCWNANGTRVKLVSKQQ